MSFFAETQNTLSLRRSPRIRSPAQQPDSASKTPDENIKRESFRKNISEFFANVTRSILRIKGWFSNCRNQQQKQQLRKEIKKEKYSPSTHPHNSLPHEFSLCCGHTHICIVCRSYARTYVCVWLERTFVCLYRLLLHVGQRTTVSLDN